MGNTRIYKASKYAMGGGLVVLVIVFLGLTLPRILSGDTLETGKLVGLLGFWAIGIMLTIAPLGFRLEIDDEVVRSYFLSNCIRELRASDVVSISYGKLFPVGFGKGLIIHARINGKNARFTLGENFYGVEAVAHARQVLDPRH